MFTLLRENHGSHIAVDLVARKLHFSEGSRQARIYPVGVGKASTPTPTGSYKVIKKIIHPGGVLGTRWLGLSIPGGNYGIHGTNNPASIGGYVSNGCIRMHNEHVEEIFPLVNIGTAVDICSAGSNSGSSAGYSNPGSVSKIHTVQPGESLWEISQKYGRPLDAILSANYIANSEEIFPGQKIIIPS